MIGILKVVRVVLIQVTGGSGVMLGIDVEDGVDEMFAAADAQERRRQDEKMRG